MFHGSPYPQAGAASQIVTTDISGQPFNLAKMQGVTVLLYFGYTYCPDVCPATLADLLWVVHELDDPGRLVRVVFVTVDPERDTPENLQKYLDRFSTDFIGLSVGLSQLEEIKKAYGVFAEKEAPTTAGDYFVSHTSRVFLIDPMGRLVTNYGFGTPREDILADLLHLQQEPFR